MRLGCLRAPLRRYDRAGAGGKVLVMSPFTLKESYWAGESALAGDRRLWLRPNAAGRAVYATCLGDGEQTRWNRSDFIGILRRSICPTGPERA